jgi:hypothetical protein
VYGAVLTAALSLAAGVLGAAVLALGCGLAAVPQALKTIPTTPMKASGDHLLVRDIR